MAREAEFWRGTKSTETLLIGLTDGELVWDETGGDFDWERTDALPRTLEGAFTEEPRWIDLRWARDGDDLTLRNPQFRDAVAELAAPIHGRPKDELASEEVRQHRRTVRIARAATATFALLTVLAVTVSIFALIQRNRAIDERQFSVSRELAAQSLLQLGNDPELEPAPGDRVGRGAAHDGVAGGASPLAVGQPPAPDPAGHLGAAERCRLESGRPPGRGGRPGRRRPRVGRRERRVAPRARKRQLGHPERRLRPHRHAARRRPERGKGGRSGASLQATRRSSWRSRSTFESSARPGARTDASS